MKYKIDKGTETYKKLDQMQNRIMECRKAAEKIVARFGGTQWNLPEKSIGGGIDGVILKKKPEGWMRPWRGEKNSFFPKDILINKALLQEISALPMVTYDDLNQILGFEEQKVGNKKCFHPGLTWHGNFDCALVSVPEYCEYNPISDMVEITVSEFKRIYNSSKQIQDFETVENQMN